MADEDRSTMAAVVEGMVQAMAQTVDRLQRSRVGDYSVILLVFDRETGELQVGTQHGEKDTLSLVSTAQAAMSITIAERECITTTAVMAESL